MADVTNEDDDWMDTQAVLKLKGWSKSTLQAKVKARLVKRHKYPGQKPMYRKSELTTNALMQRAEELLREAGGSQP